MDHCLTDSVPIYRRKGGGEAVLLFPGVAVITAAFRKERREELVEIEAFLNGIVEKIQRGIFSTMDIPLHIRGMGDLCIENKKILGSSVYSTRNFISYYGSLIVGGNPSLMSVATLDIQVRNLTIERAAHMRILSLLLNGIKR